MHRYKLFVTVFPMFDELETRKEKDQRRFSDQFRGFIILCSTKRRSKDRWSDGGKEQRVYG